MERTAFLLKEGMNKTEVKATFAGYPILNETNEVMRVEDETKMFGTNRICCSRILFNHKQTWGSLSDYCVVYFDTNDVIIAYEYTLIH